MLLPKPLVISLAMLGACVLALGCNPPAPPVATPSNTTASGAAPAPAKIDPIESAGEAPARETPAGDASASEPAGEPPATEPPKDESQADLNPPANTPEVTELKAPLDPDVIPPTDADSETVLLGGPELTSGIPGDGPLTVAQIREWLDDPANHVQLDVTLPVGIGLMQPQGLDENPLTRAKVELGRQLYFDGRLSSDGTISCASCHHPDEGYGRQTQFGEGVGGQTGNRNSPVSYNRIVSGAQFWDGRAASLEDQAKGPIANPIEMGSTHEAAVATVKGLEGYRIQFEKIFADQEVSIDNIAAAIASFERVLVSNPAPYDYYEPLRALAERVPDLIEDEEAFKEEEPDLYERYVELKKDADALPMTDSAKRGRDLFFGKANCTACHAGANFTDEKYHNLGVGMEVEQPDLGRFEVTKEEKDKGAFKTPTCRNVVFSAPYMHDGSQKTLEEVVEWYDKGGHPNPYLSDKVKKLNLTDQEKKDLVEFMKQGLTSEFTPVKADRLPTE